MAEMRPNSVNPQDRDVEPCEVERYELREPLPYTFSTDRREFVQLLGAGLMIAVAAEGGLAQQRSGRRARRDESLSDRLHIAEEGTVTVFTSKVEVGQGSRTQITQAAAEELRLPIDRIQLVMADTELCPDDGGTAGSRTTPSTVPRVRNACAAARQRLIEVAARTMEVDAGNVKYADGQFTAGEGRSVTLADLARNESLVERFSAAAPEDVQVRHVNQWEVLGRSITKVNGEDVVTGKHRYVSDLRLPNMVYGKVLRPASYGATLESIDLAPAKAMKGVAVVQDGEFVGCTAPNSWQAQKAVEALQSTAKWQRPRHPSSSELFKHLKQTAASSGSRRGRRSGNEWNDPASALKSADKRLTAAYEIAYIQHAPMEPRAALAQWEDGKLTVWTGTQQPSRVHGELCQTFRLDETQARLIVPDTGGGFGGKHSGEAAVEAARLAKAVGKPVSLQWTREEEFTWAYFRPAGLIEVDAALDANGELVAWDFTNYNSGGSALETPYTIPHGRTRFISADSPLRQGSYRALASTANTFAREAAMDELAELAGADPLDFRLKYLEDGRLKDVLMAASDRFGWRDRRAQNRAVGIACGTEKGSYVAACAEVDVEDGRIRVKSVCQAYECGAIQNPANLKAQVEGCLVMGLGGALTEEISFENGRITNASFSSYKVPRMSDVPELDIVLVDRKDLSSVGAGETPIIAIAPAIAGGVYEATGRRCRSLPLKA